MGIVAERERLDGFTRSSNLATEPQGRLAIPVVEQHKSLCAFACMKVNEAAVLGGGTAQLGQKEADCLALEFSIADEQPSPGWTGTKKNSPASHLQPSRSESSQARQNQHLDILLRMCRGTIRDNQMYSTRSTIQSVFG